MNSRSVIRTQHCDRAQAQIRLTQARGFLDAAELMGSVDDDLASPGVAAALAVLAGIAASDALCCLALGERARGQNHGQAIELLKQVEPDGKALARDLSRLLDIKDGASYGMVFVTETKAAGAIRQAGRIVNTAEKTLHGL